MPSSPKRQKSLPPLDLPSSYLQPDNTWPRSITLPIPLQSFAPSTLRPSAKLAESWLYPSSNLPLARRRKRRSRTSLLARMARTRPLQLVILASIPFLAFLLLFELKEHRTRRDLSGPDLNILKAMELGMAKGWIKPDLELYRREITREADRERDRKGKGKAAERDLDWERNVWPEWWGNADKVGRSPFDFVPLDHVGHKRRVLFLTDYKDYLERMNTHTYELIDAALRHPSVKVDVWGPGWAGYNASLPLSVNSKRRSWRIYRLERAKQDWEERMQMREAAVKKRMREISGRAWWDWADVRGTMRTKMDARASVGGLSLNGVEATSLAEYPGKFIPPEWGENEGDQSCNDEVKWDIIWTISDIFKQNDPLVDVLDCGALLAQQIGDCHETRCLNEWYPYANNITLSKYAFELVELFDYKQVEERWPDFRMGIFGHSPDTGSGHYGNEWDFWPVRWSEKKRDAMMFGFDGSFYPIRITITDHLNTLPVPVDEVRSNTSSASPRPGLSASTLQNATKPLTISSAMTETAPPFLIQRQPHPGYTLVPPSEAYEKPLETYTPNHPFYSGHIAKREEFARAMRESRVCVFDSSLERKMIRKYAQAMLSGCVIAADLPTEHESALKNFIIPLKPSWDVSKIEAAIQSYLDQPEILEKMALEGFAYARRHLTTTKKVQDVLDMASAYRQGERGYIYQSHMGSHRDVDLTGAGKRLGDLRGVTVVPVQNRRPIVTEINRTERVVLDEMPIHAAVARIDSV